MARTSLRQRVIQMEEGDVFPVPKGYEEISVRNVASVIGSSLGRKYSVVKNVEKKTYTIIRNS